MSRKKKKSKKRWIVLNGERQDFDEKLPHYLIDSPTKLKRMRPRIHGHKRHRYVKDHVYLLIGRHLTEFGISGRYLGLAGAHAPEIYQALGTHVKGEFYNCQIRQEDYQKLLRYQPFLAHSFKRIDFCLYHADILDIMAKTRQKYAILDLDFMWILNEKKIFEVVKAIERAAAERATIAIWHSANRVETNGDKRTNKVYRPKLFSSIEKHFTILAHDQIEYYEGYPMRTDIFSLERKSECKKVSLRAA